MNEPRSVDLLAQLLSQPTVSRNPNLGLIHFIRDYLAGWGVASELFLNAGLGFHSNDARGTVITVDPSDRTASQQPVPLLVRTRGTEIGARTQALKGLDTGFSLAELCALYLSRSLLESVAGTPFQRDLGNAFERLERALSPRMRQFLDRLPRCKRRQDGHWRKTFLERREHVRRHAVVGTRRRAQHVIVLHRIDGEPKAGIHHREINAQFGQPFIK